MIERRWILVLVVLAAACTISKTTPRPAADARRCFDSLELE